MEDNYNEEFDKLFARDLKQAGKNASPESHDWAILSARLDAATVRAPWYLLLLWLLIPLLVTSNILSMWHWRTLRDEVLLLKQQSTRDVTAPVVNSGTLSEHHTTIVHDTIYRTVVITRQLTNQNTTISSSFTNKNERLSPTLSGNNSLKSFSDEITKNNSTQNIENQHDSENLKANSGSLKPNLSIPPDNIVKSDLSTDSLKQTVDIATSNSQNAVAINENKPDSLLKKPELLQPDFDSVMKSPAPIIKRHHDPLRWRLGLGLGVVGTTNIDAMRLTQHFATSLQGELLLGKHWTIAPGLFYISYEYRIEEPYDPRLSLIAPPPPSPEYEFRHFEGRMQQLSPSIALRYRFRPEKNCSFYLGTGYTAQINLTKYANCEYTEHGTGQEFFYEAPVNAPNRWSMGITQAGTELVLNSHWRIFGEVNGVFDLGRSPRTAPLFIGQIGLKWGLK